MATVEKDFKIKKGLIVEGTTGTINNHDILTKKQDDQNYIVSLIGGTSTPINTPNTVVKRDANGNFAAGEITADIVGDVTGNSDTATTLETSRTIELTGDVTGSVSFNGSQNVQIQAVIDGSFATDAEVATAKGEAINAAASDATTKANAAQAAAEATASADATTKANAAQAAAEATASADATTKANAAEQNAKGYADGLIDDASNLSTEVWSAYKTSTEIGLAQAAAELHADNAIAALVDSAPATLDTLNELAAALQDNPDIIGDLQNIAAGKQDTLTAGEGIYIDANDVITGRQQAGGGLKFVFDEAAIDRTTVDTWYDASGSADGVQDNLDLHTNATSEVHGVYGDVVGTSDQQTLTNKSIDGVSNTISNIANSSLSNSTITVNGYSTSLGDSVTLSTDDVSEGEDNLYYTNARARAEAVSLLTGPATELTHIQIASNANGGLTITAENGVADSTTDDLAEGGNHLYFTDERAIDAVSNADIYPNAVIIDNVAKQVAGLVEVATASEVTAYSWAKADYRTAKFLVKTAYGTHTDVAEVLLTLDTSDNIAITEYAMVGTNGSAMTISADVSGSDVRLRVSTVNNNSTVTVLGTLLA
jgi:hypothetical protein